MGLAACELAHRGSCPCVQGAALDGFMHSLIEGSSMMCECMPCAIHAPAPAARPCSLPLCWAAMLPASARGAAAAMRERLCGERVASCQIPAVLRLCCYLIQMAEQPTSK